MLRWTIGLLAGMGFGVVVIFGFVVYEMDPATRAVLLFLVLVGIYSLLRGIMSMYMDRSRQPEPTVPMLAPAQHQPPIIIVGGAALPAVPQQQALPEPGSINLAGGASRAPGYADIFAPIEDEA